MSAIGDFLGDPDVQDPLGIFSDFRSVPHPEAKDKEKPKYMPLPDDEKANITKRASRKKQAKRRGRADTINTAISGGTLG